MKSKLADCRSLVRLVVAVIAFSACGTTEPEGGQINSEEDTDVGTEDSGPIDCF